VRLRCGSFGNTPPIRTHQFVEARGWAIGVKAENQRHALMAAAEQRGWRVVKVYEYNGISGATGRDKRPGL
jgi:hypothetical protein